ncbi:MAG: hypothetical protein KDD84_13265, partial [Caldilineaceae bacterium]|nr:hypothetical protein [Caldilineaceae bacterium]
MQTLWRQVKMRLGYVGSDAPRFTAAARRLSIRTDRLWLLLPLLALPAMWPYISRGWPNSADGTLHLLRLALLDHHIAAGFFYPRWVPELMLGNGYPVFNYYAPATYYVAEALHLLGLGYYTALMMSFAIFVAVAGIGAYRLALDLFGRKQHDAAFVAGVAYMYAPYLLSNVFIRGAIAEVGAQMLMPWIFWSVRRLILAEKPWRYLLAVAFSMGGLALTHNITLLFATPVLLIYTLVIWWQAGRRFGVLTRVGVGFAAAMGLSAIFWLPLIGERAYLADTAYEVSLLFMPENVWNWSNFVDLHLFFEYTFSPPYQLGWLQLTLAIIGFALARRWDGEWLYFGAVTLLLSLAIGAWTLPLWFSVELLQIAQFPWRLLVITSLPLALFAAAPVTRLSVSWRRAAVVIALALLIVIGQRPQLDWIDTLPSDSDAVRLSSVAQFELETGSLGTSSAQEFVPRWVEDFYYTPAPDDGEPADGVEMTVSAANAFEVIATVAAPSDTFLRFATYFFPGWQVHIDGATQETYPTTSLSLLTVDLPAGVHEVRLIWTGTGLQHWAEAISLITLLLLAILCWGIGLRRWSLLPALLGMVGLAAMLYTPTPPPLSTTAQSIAGCDVELVGYTAAQDNQFLLIRPYWHVQRTPGDAFRLRWQLQNADGNPVAALDTRPRYNGISADSWPPGTFVDDGYEM